LDFVWSTALIQLLAFAAVILVVVLIVRAARNK
jgi:hypothetical protein